MVLVAVAAMITAGIWQLHRLSERREQNSTVTNRSELPIVEIQALAGFDDDYHIGEDIEFRSVSAAGVYQVEGQVLIRNRTYQGSAGYWVLTPLLLQTGDIVAVNRG